MKIGLPIMVHRDLHATYDIVMIIYINQFKLTWLVHAVLSEEIKLNVKFSIRLFCKHTYIIFLYSQNDYMYPYCMHNMYVYMISYMY